ncbi:actin nucleation-promoting factor WASL-like [Mustelus asterias]
MTFVTFLGAKPFWPVHATDATISLANWSDSTDPSPSTEILNSVTPNLDISNGHYWVIGSTPGSALEKRKGRSNRSKLSKSEIGTPTNFRHIGHVAWDPETGFDMKPMDPELLQQTGTNGSLKGAGSIQLLHNVTEQKEGIESLRKEVRLKAAAGSEGTASTSNAHELPPYRAGTGPAATSARAKGGQQASPSLWEPTPLKPGTPLAPSPHFGDPSSLSFAFCAPIAPPSPPPAFDGIAPPPPNNLLLEDIRQGARLNPVEMGKSLGATGCRYRLLDEIRQGCVLKSISDSPISRPVPLAEPNDIVGALLKVMQKRSRVIHSSTDFEDDDEWDD